MGHLEGLYLILLSKLPGLATVACPIKLGNNSLGCLKVPGDPVCWGLVHTQMLGTDQE